MGVSRALANSPLGCFASRCGGNGLFDPSTLGNKNKSPSRDTAGGTYFYAGDGGRTHTVSPPTDFESPQMSGNMRTF